MAEEEEIKPEERQAAVLLMALGEKVSTQVFKSLSPKEVLRLGTVISQLGQVDKEEVKVAMATFLSVTKDQTSLGMNNEEYIRKTLNDALGEDVAGGIIDKILQGQNTKGLETLKWIGSRSVAELIKNEHPQTIAIILDYLDATDAAEVLALIPPRLQHDIIMRIATLETIHPNAMIELNKILEDQLTGNASIKAQVAGGPKSAAEILNFVDTVMEKRLMEQMEKMDLDMTEDIKELMFVFEDLKWVEDKAMQGIIRGADLKVLTVALKGAADDLKEKFFKNMSKRAAEGLKDDIENAGTVRLTDIEESQKEILSTARRLEESGEIYLGKG
jgi:flagellar motor switch protein FliG